MSFSLPPLPYDQAALTPYLSEETLSYHYGKHHQAYVNNLNQLVPGTAFEGKDLETIIKEATGPIFNNAAQIWNHSFYWSCLSPTSGGQPKGFVADQLTAAFGSFEQFREAFTKAAVGAFGSAWAWLVADDAGKLSIMTTFNAGTPMTDGKRAILTCDVWEHAYYIDYRNRRPDYLEAYWDLVNWDFVEKGLRGHGVKA